MRAPAFATPARPLPHRTGSLAAFALLVCACGGGGDGAVAGDGATGGTPVPTVDAGGTPSTADGAVDATATPTVDARPPAPDGSDGLADASPPLPDAAAPLWPLAHPVDEVCADDLRPGEAVVFAEGFDRGSEGIAAGPDALYVSSPRAGEIRRVLPDGTSLPFVTLPDALGLAFLSDGRLAVADIGATNDPGVPDGGVWLVEPDGTATKIVSGLDSPNFVTVLPDDSLLVSDDFDTRVWHVGLDGEVTPALSAVPSPNGMALDLARTHLWVVSTFTPDGEVSLYPLGEGGLPIEAMGTVVARGGAGITQDGVALDAHDQLYVARNVAGVIARHAPEEPETPTLLKPDGMRTPASLAFGRAPGFDPCSLYVTELFGTRVWRVAVGAPGAPLP
ncbi:SMP-30/gluconolactonase/LRE family protein [Myxococcota bacterium]|nr:SMP-30/gluconolactonase/LRE family protein [Myxococcota bacterium]